MLDIGNGIAAHRGNMSEFPENTIASFKSAIEIGSDWLELDIQRTLDGHLVVTHDENSIRVTGIDVIVSKTNLNELKELNYGYYFNTEIKFELPLLSEVFELVKGNKTRITIQPKANGLVKDSIKLAEDMGALSQIAFNEVNCEYLIEAKLCNSNIPVFWDRLEGTDLDTDLYIAKQYGFETLMYLNEALTKEKVDIVHSNGIHCGACVVNNFEDMDKYLSWGINMFYTDYPKTLKSKK